MKVYGVSVSYFTGKMEAYLRYKGIEYDKNHPFADQKRIREHVGAIQVPLIERDDGRWMSDTTPMIQQLETEYPDRPVMPADPVVRFIALLMEDYADEWLWRSAMHYRWSYDHGRELISRVLADEILSHLWYPRIVRRHLMKFRQRVGYVVNDGVNAETWDHVEAGYFNALRNMTTMLEDRPFLLGNSPSIADFGFMGPMFRHFSQDPDPTAIMRDKAPDVFEWVGRVWNASKRYGETALLEQVPDDAAPEFLAGRFVWQPGTHHDELVASQPGDEVNGADGVQQACGHLAQQAITGGMAEPVVDGFEPVEVDVGESQKMLCIHPRQRGTEHVHQPAPIRQAGERVRGRGVVQTAFTQANVRDVLELDDPGCILVGRAVVVTAPCNHGGHPNHHQPGAGNRILGGELAVGLRLINGIHRVEQTSYSSLFVVGEDLQEGQVFLVGQEIFPKRSICQ